ncbi:hypothetical protein ABT039_22295 [Streptomyces lasiicapitis]|uniref:hypothetical protein n=1 Tax=Streptomyces lasiicapitis TaxID=1923961 RepID=UPI0033241DB8
MQLDILTQHADTLLATALGVLLTHWRERHVRRREERTADTAALGAQVDAFTIALGAVRAVAASNQVLWERPREKLRASTIVGLGLIGGWARADAGGSSAWPMAAGLADAAHLLSREVHASKLASVNLHGPMLQLGAAATPLLRHPDERLAQATDAVITAARAEDTAQLDAAVRALARASREALAPQPSLWARLRRRRD